MTHISADVFGGRKSLANPSCHPTNSVKALKGKFRLNNACSHKVHFLQDIAILFGLEQSNLYLYLVSISETVSPTAIISLELFREVQ